MSAKPDRKSMLRSSIRQEAASVEHRFPAEQIDKRFAAADEALLDRPQGLVGPRSDSGRGAPDLRAEIERSTSGQQRIVSVPIERAHDNPVNARQIYDPEVVKSLAASIATRGQLVAAPAVAHPTSPGDVILIDGHYRKRALLAAGKSTIEVVLHPAMPELELYRMSFLINEERNGQSALDNAIAWKKLLDDGRVADGEGIAELTGLSPAAVTKTMALIKLPPAAIARMRETPAKFGSAVGYEIYRFAKLLDEPALLQLMERVVSEDLSSRTLDQMRQKQELARPRKIKEVSRQYKIKEAGRQIGVLKEWDSGRIALEVNLRDPQLREQLVADLKRHFGLELPHVGSGTGIEEADAT